MDIQGMIKSRGFTQAKVAEALGMNTGNFSVMIRGNITIESLRRIATAIGCKVTDFFDDENEHVDHPTQEVNLKCPHCGKEITITAK